MGPNFKIDLIFGNMVKKALPIINRELSWLFFNERVLQEADDPTVPLIERIRFLAIFSSNLDEFFRVRVASLNRLKLLGARDKEKLGYRPENILNKIKKMLPRQQEKFDRIYNEIIIPQLAEEKIFLINEKQLNVSRGSFVRSFFNQTILPTLVPIMLDGVRKFPRLKDETIYFIISLSRKDGNIKEAKALIELPVPLHSRFLVLPETGKLKYIILLDDVIRYCLDDIFSIFGYDRFHAYAVKLTRDAELDFDSDLSETFLEKMSKSLKKRKEGRPVRFIFDKDIREELLAYLVGKIRLKPADLHSGGKYHNFKDFFHFPSVGVEHLEYPGIKPLLLPGIDLNQSLTPMIRQRNVLLSFPYQSFDYVIHFLREAAIDPKVATIRITLYRLAQHSMVINALINAAKNGKKVFVLMELKARFDEEANIYWTGKLEEEGVTVKYGLPNLKVHSKICLVTRRENKELINFAYLATGNFNEKTARVYADHGYFTTDARITSELEKAFSDIETGVVQDTYKHLWVAPMDMRKKITRLISAEIKNARNGKPAYITMKLNSLSDEKIIAKLYEASAGGVKIRLIVRGICCLIPSVKGLSDNIEVISIIDRYLEHARVYIFAGGGKEQIYLSSADLMPRNIDHRFEVGFPVFGAENRQQIRDMIEIQWKDNTKSRIIDKAQQNPYRKTKEKENHRAQRDIYNYLK